MEVHVVMEGARIVGVSATPEGAEQIRSGQADTLARQRVRYNTDLMRTAIYNRMQIHTHHLQHLTEGQP